MKKRTLIAAWVYIAISLISALAVRVVKASSLPPLRFGIHSGKGLVILVDNLIINVLLVAGWVLLMRGREWARWVLVVLYAAILARLGVQYAQYADRWDIILLIGASSALLFSVLPILLLLSDEPQGKRSSATPHEAGGPKPRTRIAAYIFAIITGFLFLSALVFFGTKWKMAVAIVPGTAVWPFWVMLGRGRKLAWTVLTVAYSVMPAVNVVSYLPAFHDMIGRNVMTMPTPGRAIIGTLMIVAVTSGIPLAFLLTDRPSRWSEPEPAAEKPAPKTHGPRPRNRRHRR